MDGKSDRKNSILCHLCSLINSFQSLLGTSSHTQFAAYDSELPSCWLGNLTRDGAKCFVHRQPGSNSTCHQFDRVRELSKQLIGQATLLPSKQTSHHHYGHNCSRERRVEGGKFQHAISIEDCRSRDDTGK